MDVENIYFLRFSVILEFKKPQYLQKISFTLIKINL